MPIKASFSIAELSNGEFKLLYLGSDILAAIRSAQESPKGASRVDVYRKGRLFRSKSAHGWTADAERDRLRAEAATEAAKKEKAEKAAQGKKAKAEESTQTETPKAA